MLIKEEIFNSWLKKTQPQISNPNKYTKTITTLTNHLKKQNISDLNLFSIDSFSEIENIKELYFANKELYEKNERGNKMYSRAFDLYLEFLKDNFKSENIVEDIIKIYNQTNITKTEKKNYIFSRIGQGFFRKQLIEYWNSCAVTGFIDTSLLIASHIKPWKKSNNFEKLDVFNGLLLIPNLDKVFDLGLISFDENGKIIISKLLKDYQTLGINKNMKINITLKHKPYLDYHRKNILKNK